MNLLIRIFLPHIAYLERHGWRQLRTGKWSNGCVTLGHRAAVKYQRTIGGSK